MRTSLYEEHCHVASSIQTRRVSVAFTNPANAQSAFAWLDRSGVAEPRPSWSDMSERDRGGRRHHKDLQLCRQVFDALTYALAELDDPRIAELVLASVVPAPNSSRVLVTLVATREDLADPDAALARIDASVAELREEVAAEITRQRVPELVFRIAPRAALAELR